MNGNYPFVCAYFKLIY